MAATKSDMIGWLDSHLTKKILVDGEAPDVERLKLEFEAQFKFAITGKHQ